MSSKPIDRLLEIMRTLRSEGGCPWDREQTLESLKPFLVEETYEVLEAIDLGDRDALKEELGDVLLQVVFQACCCEEEGSFSFDDVVQGLSDKLVRRHPHVFGEVRAADSEEVLRRWQVLKRSEGKPQAPPLLADVGGAPALMKAQQVQRRAAEAGFDWDSLDPVLAKVEEEIRELRAALRQRSRAAIRDELGDLLFAAVNVSRAIGEDAEHALHLATAKFARRFEAVRKRLEKAGKAMAEGSPAELDAVWEQVKAAERRGPTGALPGEQGA